MALCCYSELQRLIPQATPKIADTTAAGNGMRQSSISNSVIPSSAQGGVFVDRFGKSLIPILTAMYDWGADYMKDNGKEISCSMSIASLVRKDQVFFSGSSSL